ncbi:hypothetical protein D3C76_1657150 [compost metagenome]
MLGERIHIVELSQAIRLGDEHLPAVQLELGVTGILLQFRQHRFRLMHIFPCGVPCAHPLLVVQQLEALLI